MLGRDVLDLLGDLDPELEDSEIAHLSLEVLTPPRVALIAYVSGAARTNASPRIAERQGPPGAR
jgi:hypothetical protein